MSELHEIHEIATNTDELLQCICAVNTTKSSAIDNLSLRILKDAFTCLIDQFTDFSECIPFSGHLPK